MKNPKRKGNMGENKFAEWMRSQGLETWKNAGSGSGINKSDVHNSLGINFEVKTVKALNFKQAWKQSCRDAEMTHSSPYLVVHFDGMPENEWMMVMSNWDWLELFKNSRPTDFKESMQTNRSLKYSALVAKESIRKLLKELEKEE